MAPTAEKYNQQLRGFIAVWLAITLFIGVITFFGIYVGTGELDTATAKDSVDEQPIAEMDAVANASEDNTLTEDTAIVQVQPVEEAPAAVMNNNDTMPLEEAPVDAPPPQDSGQSLMLQQEPTPTLQPTIPPLQDTRFDLGIQVLPNFNSDPQIIEEDMDAVANQLNLNWVKLQVRWEFVEPSPGIYDWEKLGFDTFFQKATEKNLKVLISVVSSPEWAREPGADLSRHGPPADNQVFANFIGNMISRYPGQIHAVEVWNEMNLSREWSSPRGLNAADYVTMVSTVANTIRFLDPNIMVVSGALAPTGVNDATATDDFIYTDQLIASGLLNVVDCFGAHHNGYNIGPNVPWDQVPNDPTAMFRGPFDNPHHSWSFYSTLNTYANKIRAAGSDVPLCVTEFGWPVAEDLDPAFRPIPGFEFAEDNTLEEQREFFVEAIQLMEQWGFVRLAIIWNLNYGKEAGWNLNRADRDNIPYSLIRPGYQQAPAWAYIRDMDFRSKHQQ